MIYVLGFFLAYVIVSLWYIHRIHARMRAYEQEWVRIQELSDLNKDGDVVIHLKHIE